MTLLRLATLTLLVAAASSLSAQMIMTESISIALDTTKRIQGSIEPELEFRTERENVFVLKNLANINIMLSPRYALTIINKLELSTYGKTAQISEGFVYTEYRRLLSRWIEVHPFVQAQWVGSRGMELRLLGGAQTRIQLYRNQHLSLSTGMGLFYEYEKWKDDHVPDSPTLHLHSGKALFFLAFRLALTDQLSLITSGYYQGKLNSEFGVPRLAYGLDLKYRIQEHFGLWGAYSLFYDQKPPIDIDKAYTKVSAGVSIHF